jgi:DNA gyrase subunit A
VKKTPFKDYDTPIRADGIIAINIKKGDELVRVRMTSGKDDIIMVSKSGHAIRFNEKLARPMGRGTAGVKGMNVADKGNRVLSLDVVSSHDKEGELLVVTENGYGKRTSLSEYPVKGRGGKGVLTAKLTAKKGGLAGARVVRESQELIFISQTGMVQRNAVSGISRMGRPTQGVRVMNLKTRDRVSAVALVVESTDADGNGRSGTAAAVEEDAPTAESVAEEAAAAEAAGNGEAKVTRAQPSTTRTTKPKPSKSRSSGGSAKPSSGRKSATKTKADASTSPAKKRATTPRGKASTAPRSKPKPGSASTSRPKVKPKHTATAKQRAESAAKKKR